MLAFKKLQSINRQAGYILFETTVSTFVLISAVVGVLAVQTMMSRIDQGKVVGQQYARINEAVGQYMTVYYKELKALDTNCSELQFQDTNTQTLTTSISTPNACRITLTSGASTFTIANGMQPTVAELGALGFIDANTLGAPALDADTITYERTTTGSYDPAPLRFHIGISQRCIAISQPPNTLSARYVLVRSLNSSSTAKLALDELEVIADGVNIAPSAFSVDGGAYYSAEDATTGAIAFYSRANITDGKTSVKFDNRKITLANGDTQYTALPGLFVTNSGTSNTWVTLDLGAIKNISSVGIRRGTGADWEAQGDHLEILVSKDSLTNSSSTSTNVVAAQVHFSAFGSIAANAATPAGQTHYLSPTAFSPAPTSSQTTVTTPTMGLCPAGTMTALSSIVFNTQPFVLKQWAGAGAMLATVKAQGGASGLMSDMITGGVLVGNRSILTLSNPIKSANPAQAPARIIAFTNGYDPYNAAVQTRADGSTPPTSAWNFNLQSLSGIAGLNAASATVNNDLAVGGSVKANRINTETANSRSLSTESADAKSVNITGNLALTNRTVVINDVCQLTTQNLASTATGEILYCKVNMTGPVPDPNGVGQWKTMLSQATGSMDAQTFYEYKFKVTDDNTIWTSVDNCANQACITTTSECRYSISQIVENKAYFPLSTPQIITVSPSRVMAGKIGNCDIDPTTNNPFVFANSAIAIVATPGFGRVGFTVDDVFFYNPVVVLWVDLDHDNWHPVVTKFNSGARNDSSQNEIGYELVGSTVFINNSYNYKKIWRINLLSGLTTANGNVILPRSEIHVRFFKVRS